MAHRYGKFTSRTRARKRAADVLFEADQKGIVANRRALLSLLEERQQLTAAASPLPEYATRLVQGVAEDYAQIQRLLEGRAEGAGLDRIPAVDLAVMRVATWELLRNQEEVPPISAIDEAVAIVKELSTDDSPSYVNAVLDAIRKDLESPWARVSDGAVTPTSASDQPFPDSVSDQVKTAVITTDDDSDGDADDDLDELLGEY